MLQCPFLASRRDAHCNSWTVVLPGTERARNGHGMNTERCGMSHAGLLLLCENGRLVPLTRETNSRLRPAAADM